MTLSSTEWRQRFAITPDRFASLVAAEVRAMMARRGITQTMMAAELDVTQMYVSRRITKSDKRVPIDVEDLAKFAQVLDCSIADLLPRLDSNQQPSDFTSSQVSVLRAA